MGLAAAVCLSSAERAIDAIVREREGAVAVNWPSQGACRRRRRWPSVDARGAEWLVLRVAIETGFACDAVDDRRMETE